jgi:hypothetical protein
MSANHRFTIKQERLLNALLASNSIADAAKRAGISEKQAYRLCQTPSFREKWESLKDSAAGLCMSLAQAELGANFQKLKELRDDAKTPASVRAGAIVKMIDMGLEVVKEKLEHQRDMAKIEAYQKQLAEDNEN